MRKMTMAVMAAAALAVALPAAAQPNYNGGYDQRYDRDRGGYDRGGYDRNAAYRLINEFDRLDSQVRRDYQSGRMGKNQAKNFFKAIENNKHAIRRVMDKNGGYMRPEHVREYSMNLDHLRRQYADAQRDNRWGRR